MDIDEKLGVRNDKFNILKSLLKFVLFFLTIPLLLFFLICYNALNGFNFDDANIKCPINSKKAWEYFINSVSNDTTNINNVKAEDHSNLMQNEYLVEFETDSFTMYKIIAKNNLHSSNSLNSYWKSTSNAITKLDYTKKGSTYYVVFSYEEAGGARDFACDDFNQRCIGKIEDTISNLIKDCYTTGKYRITCDSLRNNHLYFNILPNGSIIGIFIDSTYCNLPKAFTSCLYNKLELLNLGKITKDDTVAILIPIKLR